MNLFIDYYNIWLRNIQNKFEYMINKLSVLIIDYINYLLLILHF